ncbi:MAG: SAM hydrolase/SAM-dependent halogenase family protein [Pyrinomonadaceae bacterium]
MTRRRGDKKSNPRVAASPRLRVAASKRHRVSSSRAPLITLLTDFGNADYFVAAMKGVILSINPAAHIVDITHDIPPQDIEAAAFTLLAAHSSFPAGTINVCVVDPGVGSARRPVLVEAGGQSFVGPDNGIFSYVSEREPATKVFELTNDTYFRHPVSTTFHGRDIFAPVAAALSNGVKPKELGKAISDPFRLESLLPQRLENGTLKARIVHIDRFGNCITNLTPQNLTDKMIEEGAYLVVNKSRISSFRKFFSDSSGSGEEVFGLWGSAGFLELAAMNRSAVQLLKARRGDLVILSMKPG